MSRKIVIKGDNGNAAYMARRRAEKEQYRFMCATLIKWPRGFDPVDAPPHLNEWTRAPTRGIIGSR